LTIVNLINQTIADIFIDEMECLIEGPARGDNAQVVVEHQKRVANRIDDGVRKRGRVWNDGKWRSLRHYGSQHMNFLPRFRARAIQREFSTNWRERRDASFERRIVRKMHFYGREVDRYVGWPTSEITTVIEVRASGA